MQKLRISEAKSFVSSRNGIGYSCCEVILFDRYRVDLFEEEIVLSFEVYFQEATNFILLLGSSVIARAHARDQFGRLAVLNFVKFRRFYRTLQSSEEAKTAGIPLLLFSSKFSVIKISMKGRIDN